MITATTTAKYAPAAIAPLAMIDWHLAGGMAFGYVSGLFVAAAVQMKRREPASEILRETIINLMISGGCLLVILYAVRAFNLDDLGAALCAFVMAVGGVKLLNSLVGAVTEAAVNWLRVRITASPDDKTPKGPEE